MNFVKNKEDYFLKDCIQLVEYNKLSKIIMGSMNEVHSFAEASQYVINAICLFNNWEIGHLYIKQKDKIVSSDVWFLSDKESFKEIVDVTMKSVFNKKEGFMGRVFSEQKLFWISNISDEPDFLRKDVFLKNNVNFILCLPVVVKQEVVAVLEFFSIKPWLFNLYTRETLNQISLELSFTFDRFFKEEKNKKQNKFNQLLKEISSISNLAVVTKDALAIAIKKICFYTDWDVGHVYFLKQRYPDMAEFLTPSDIWYIEDEKRFSLFKEATMKTFFPSGSGLPGRILADKKYHQINIIEDIDFQRAEPAKRTGLKTAFGLPIFSAENKTVAVLEFFSQKEKDDDVGFFETMINASVQLNRIFERSDFEGKLWKQINSLKKMEKATVDRELKMIELKNQIKKLTVNCQKYAKS